MRERGTEEGEGRREGRRAGGNEGGRRLLLPFERAEGKKKEKKEKVARCSFHRKDFGPGGDTGESCLTPAPPYVIHSQLKAI